MKQIIVLFFLFSMFNHAIAQDNIKIRQPVDSIGFATKSWQMDSIMNRLTRIRHDPASSSLTETPIRFAICPHDDYSYVQSLYPKVLSGINARTIIIFGVGHKAKSFKLSGKIVFDDFDFWKASYGNVKISGLRGELINLLPQNSYCIHDSIHLVEHSIEALVPFLQYFDKDVEIIPVIIPYMSFNEIDTISAVFADALSKLMLKKNLKWGKDIVLISSSDAVHYGDEDWGGQSFAAFGVDSTGYYTALQLEIEIVQSCFTGEVDKNKPKRLMDYTLSENDIYQYIWPWCGRFSIPFGMMTSLHLSGFLHDNMIRGYPAGYTTSISQSPLKVEDLGMGKTAIASLRHWVGYAGVLFY